MGETRELVAGGRLILTPGKSERIGFTQAMET
jgi:hypothetical protein